MKNKILIISALAIIALCVSCASVGYLPGPGQHVGQLAVRIVYQDKHTQPEINSGRIDRCPPGWSDHPAAQEKIDLCNGQYYHRAISNNIRFQVEIRGRQ